MEFVQAFAAGTRGIGRKGAMKAVLGSSVAALVLVGSSGAFAADLPVKAPVMAPIAIYNWTGFYIGGNVGGVWDTVDVTDNFFGVSVSNTRSGFIGGGQIGYNWQLSPQMVIGFEWMFDGTSLHTDFGPVLDPVTGATFSASEKTDWLTTLTARLGYAANNWLFYVKGGGGWVHDRATATVIDNVGNVFSASATDTRGGWVVGAGIEYGFTPNWTGKVEYQHLGLGDVTTASGFPGDPGVTLSRHFDMVTVGLNYKF
jgi:outer membrane immunogenic protein